MIPASHRGRVISQSHKQSRNNLPSIARVSLAHSPAVDCALSVSPSRACKPMRCVVGSHRSRSLRILHTLRHSQRKGILHCSSKPRVHYEIDDPGRGDSPWQCG